MKQIVIVGAGGFGREVKMLIDQINGSNDKYEFLGYYDDGHKIGTIINYDKVLGSIDDLSKTDTKINVVVAIGQPDVKRKIVERLKINSNIDFPTLIYPFVKIGYEFNSIGKGCIICAGTIITCNIKIKDFVILNLMCTVGHDTTIGSYASFMPSVNISGEVIIKEEVYVGTGAKIINQLEIGKKTIVGAGAVVSKSLPDNCTAVGIPAKPIKFN